MLASERRRADWSARAALLHPAWWAALLVLLLNDHYLKGAAVLTPLLTGKLSDFSGLMMAPVVLAATLGPRSRGAFALSHLAVGSVFAALKLSAPCAALWCGLGGLLGLKWRVVSDASDLFALPMLGLSYWLFGARPQDMKVGRAWRRVASTLASGLGLFGIVATSRLPPRTPVLTPNGVYVPVGDALQELGRDTGKAQRRIDCDVGGWRQYPQVVGDVLYTTHATRSRTAVAYAGSSPSSARLAAPVSPGKGQNSSRCCSSCPSTARFGTGRRRTKGRACPPRAVSRRSAD